MQDYTELPIGFTMTLAMDQQAMDCYANLTEAKQNEIIQYVSLPGEGYEAKYRIEDVIHRLHNKMITDDTFS